MCRYRQSWGVRRLGDGATQLKVCLVYCLEQLEESRNFND